jgi:hypothetical protein
MEKHDHSGSSSPGNSPPRSLMMEDSLEKRNTDNLHNFKLKLNLGEEKTVTINKKVVKACQIKPNVIYLKDTRDSLLLMTEKNVRQNVPIDSHGYFGGFSPTKNPEDYTGSEIHKTAQNMDK